MTEAEYWLDSRWWILMGMKRYAFRLGRMEDWDKFHAAQREIERLEEARR